MPPQNAPARAKPEGGFFATIGNHKGLVIGGVLLLGVVVYEWRKRTATPVPASAASAVGPTSVNPYVGGSAAGMGTTTGSPGFNPFSGSSAGAFAQTLATDTASAFAKVYPPGSGPSSASTSNGTGPPAGSTINSTPNTATSTTKPVPSGTRNLVTPPRVTIKGVSFKPTRTVDVGGTTWYGIPNQPTASSLKAHGAKVQNILGGAGLYAMA